MRISTLLVAALSVLAIGCATHKPQRPATLIAAHSYVEFQPGWRIRVVIPILNSGGYKVRTEEIKSQNGTVQLKASKDFIGYEIDHYAVVARKDGGVTVAFQSAEIHTNDAKSSKTPKPRLEIFKIPGDIRYVSLAFLSRVTPTEHDAVILGAPSREEMQSLTNRLEANPSQACAASPKQVCSWIPEGVSVQPEKKRGRTWVPAI